MIPFANKTVTILHKTTNGYERRILKNCSWRNAVSRTLNGTDIVTAIETTCRIPAGQIIPKPGDLMVLGNTNISADGEIDLVRLMHRLRDAGACVFRVERVKDNTGVHMPHYAATGA